MSSPNQPSNTLSPTTALALLPSSISDTVHPPVLLAQGAEALIFRTHFLTPSRPCVLKFRPPKKWRHPTLDARLTRQRILAEARTLVKCRKEGVAVPAVYALDWEGGRRGNKERRVQKEVEKQVDKGVVGVGHGQGEVREVTVPNTEAKREGDEKTGGWMMVEWIEGGTVRNALNRWIQYCKNIGDVDKEQRAAELHGLMVKIGKAVGRLHVVGVIHGDLTTSNLMLKATWNAHANGVAPEAEGSEHKEEKPNLDGEIVIIDFGLAIQHNQDEERAVDLYVLERAYGSTHPTIEDSFQDVLKAYGESYKGARTVLKRLEDVRMRGRKKSMIG